jgi:hypothetical protein
MIKTFLFPCHSSIFGVETKNRNNGDLTIFIFAQVELLLYPLFLEYLHKKLALVIHNHTMVVLSKVSGDR